LGAGAGRVADLATGQSIISRCPAAQPVVLPFGRVLWTGLGGKRTLRILNRLVHNAYRIELDGQSMRKTKLGTGDESTQS